MRLPALLTAAAAVLLPAAAHAQETVDIGTIAEQDIVVVQRLLYPKDGRTELGVHLGVMPFDAYLVVPNLQLSFDKHLGERTSFTALLGGGYGIGNGTFRELDTPALGKRPDAYGYLGAVLAGVAWAPVYAKANLGVDRIVHHDLYGVARAGVTLEQSAIDRTIITPSPTISLGLGARVWTSQTYALRIEIRDDMMLQRRKLTETTHFKQNANVTIGITRFSPVKTKVR